VCTVATSTRKGSRQFVGQERNRNALSDCDWRLATISPRSVASALSKPSDLASLISPAPRTSTATPPVSRSALRRRRKWNVDLSFARSACLGGDDEARFLIDWFEKGYGEFVVFHRPIGHHRASTD